MAKNYINEGNRTPVTLTAAVASGDLFLHGDGDLPLIAQSDGAIGDTIVAAAEGVHSYPVASGATSTDPNQPAYFDESEDELTDTDDTGANTQVGVFWVGDAPTGSIAFKLNA